MEIIDISQMIRPGIPVWPGDQKYSQRWTARLKDGGACNVSAVTMTTHLGTHVDAPYHCSDGGLDVASISLDPYIGPARVIPISAHAEITLAELEDKAWKGVERVLFKTRSSRSPGDRFNRDYVSISSDAAEFLGSKGLLLVGTDAPSVDSFKNKTPIIHNTLMGHGIAILEGILLNLVDPGDYELICLPLRLAGLDGSPVRAILRR
jgi:arylformamidase